MSTGRCSHDVLGSSVESTLPKALIFQLQYSMNQKTIFFILHDRKEKALDMKGRCRIRISSARVTTNSIDAEVANPQGMSLPHSSRNQLGMWPRTPKKQTVKWCNIGSNHESKPWPSILSRSRSKDNSRLWHYLFCISNLVLASHAFCQSRFKSWVLLSVSLVFLWAYFVILESRESCSWWLSNFASLLFGKLCLVSRVSSDIVLNLISVLGWSCQTSRLGLNQPWRATWESQQVERRTFHMTACTLTPFRGTRKKTNCHNTRADLPPLWKITIKEAYTSRQQKA